MKIEQSLQADIGGGVVSAPGEELLPLSSLEKPVGKRESRRSSPLKRHERKRSHTLGHGQKMDTTMMSEIEYLNNFLPDMEKLEIEDSSFLRHSFVDKSGGLRQN